MTAIQTAFAAQGLQTPDRIEIGGGRLVADYTFHGEYGTRAFGEKHLIAIREVLLPHGLTTYRVNVNGDSPGTGLVRRFGSAVFHEGGAIEWKR
jgi:hypothetical protein